MDVRFDIGKGVFRLAVVVSAEDRDGYGWAVGTSTRVGAAGTMTRTRTGTVVSRSPAGWGEVNTSSRTLDMKMGVEERVEDVGAVAAARNEEEDRYDETKATEIFIPLVHFAHQGIVDDALNGWGRRNRHTGDSRSTKEVEGEAEEQDLSNKASTPETETNTIVDVHIDGGAASKPPSIFGMGKLSDSATTAVSSSSSSDPEVPQTQPVIAPCQIPDTYTPLYPTSSSSSYGTPSPTTTAEPLDLVDLIIKPSCGYTKVIGQRLLWWYDVPAEGEPERRVEIEVRRKGGVLPAPPRRVGGAKGSQQQQQPQPRQKGWCEDICSESGPCVIM